MFKIVCKNCNKETSFPSRSNVPPECSYCFAAFDATVTILETQPQQTQPTLTQPTLTQPTLTQPQQPLTGIAVIHQLTQQRIDILSLQKTILGRENFGADVFSKILFNGKPVVSRKHCSIEFKDGNFYLRDEGSLNGTFYGVNKLSCKDASHLIEDKSIFYLGEEAFLAQFIYQQTGAQATAPKQEIPRVVKLYRCNESGCGHESPTPVTMCPKCHTFNSLIPIYA